MALVPSVPALAQATAPTVTDVTPETGSAASTTSLVINGTGFAPGAQVFLNDEPAPTSYVSAAILSVVVPAGMPAGTYSVMVRNPDSTISNPLAGAYVITNEASVAYVPVVMREVGGSNTGIQVQNVSTSTAAVDVFYYDQSGSTRPDWSDAFTIAPGASATFYQGAHGGLPFGFNGSAVVQATAEVRVVVNHTNYSGPRASAGSFPGEVSGASTRVMLPTAFGGFNGYRTTVSVQNTSAHRASYTMSLFPLGVGFPMRTLEVAVEPLAAQRIQLGPQQGIPENFVGSAVVSSTAGTVAAAAETVNETNGVMLSYLGFSAGATIQNAPLLFKNYTTGWTSDAHVMNTSGRDVVLTSTLFHRDTALAFPLPTLTLAPNQSHVFHMADFTGLPDGVWSGVFNATGEIALVVNETNTTEGTGMAYSGFDEGTTTISVPLTFKSSNGWDTGIQVQNLGTIETIATVVHHLPNGGSIVEADAILPGESRTFYQPANSALPIGHVGSATITSNNGQPLVAIVNEVNYSRSGDAAMVYEGINY
jgi:hypothetical protein